MILPPAVMFPLNTGLLTRLIETVSVPLLPEITTLLPEASVSVSVALVATMFTPLALIVLKLLLADPLPLDMPVRKAPLPK